MKFKAITIATLIFLAMMALGAVSAGENMTHDTGEVLEVADNSSFEVQASVQEDPLGEGEHTFSELEDYLGGYGDGDPVALDKDYSYDDGNSTGGIPISDGLIIEGNGHTIDGKSKSRIFEIAADNVVLNNIVFVNGNSSALYINGASNVTISNCKFINCSSTDKGGAIYVGANDCLLLNCSFFNSSAKYGGSVYVANGFSGTVVDDCYFFNSTATANNDGGGAIFFHGDGPDVVKNCIFTHNSAVVSGSALIFYRKGIASNCTFTDNSANQGAAIDGTDCNVTDCIFTGNSNLAHNGGAITIYYGNIVGCTFTSNTAGGAGSAIYISNEANVTNCAFTNNSGVYGGAISMFMYSSYCAVENCSFTDNKVTGNGSCGGAIYIIANAFGEVRNCYFTDNKATGDDSCGGAIYLGEAATGEVTNCNFTNSTASNYGGAIYFGSAATGEIINCSFANSKATGVGGAVNFDPGSAGNVTNCNFVNSSAEEGGAIYTIEGTCHVVNCSFVNSVSRYGGAVQIYRGLGDILNCSFVNSTAVQSGGAVYVDEEGYCDFVNCSFLNSCSEKGGAICIDDADYDKACVVDGCSFVSSNSSAYQGGAIYFGTYITGEVTNCNFTDSSAEDNGGAIYFDKGGSLVNCSFTNCTTYGSGAVYFTSNGEVTNCNFTNNTAGSDGGAVYFYVEGTVTNCNFVNNHADEWGGAVQFNSDATGNVAYCNFVNNSASQCGAVYFNRNGNVAYCNFTNNKATGFSLRGWGGAIFFDWYSEGSVINCNFVNNTANLEGGAVYFDQYSNGSVINCNFDNNNAVSFGGAVYFDGNGNVTDCNFDNNKATGSDSCGGAVYLFEEGAVTNCNFINNTANSDGGAVYFSMVATGEIKNCDFISNSADNGGAIFVHDNNTKANNTKAINSTFTNNHANLGSALYSCDYEDCTFLGNSDPEIYFKEEDRKDAVLNVEVVPATFGEVLVVNIVLSPNIIAPVTVSLNGMEMNASVVNGTGTLHVAALSAGIYQLRAIFNGTHEYKPCNITAMFSVSKKSVMMAIETADILEGDDEVVTVRFNENVTGIVTVQVSGSNYTSEVVAGLASILISGLPSGNYTATAYFHGNENYSDVLKSSSFTVNVANTFSRLQTLIDADTTGVIELDRDYYGDSSEIVISKTITINGNGHTLNANGLSRIFNVNANGVVIRNLTFVNGSADCGGAVNFDGGSTGSVINCNFVNNSAADDGGAVFAEEGTVMACNFVNNSAADLGGAIAMGSGNVMACNFVNNSAHFGGAVYFNGDGNVTDCNFDNNKATGSDSCGGAVYLLEEGAVTNCNFINNTANSDGGAVYFSMVATGEIKNCDFISNSADNGGAIFSEGNVKFRSSNFTNDIASNGCAVYIAASGSLTVEETSFNYCAAQASGGALYILGSADMRDSSFEGNTAIVSAGVAYVGLSGSAAFDNCNFTDSVAGQDGAFYIAGSANISGCRFNNSVSYFLGYGGGAISIYSNGSANIANSSFTGSASSANGGAIFVDNGRANVTGCNFTDSFAKSGGAIYSQGELEIRGCIFSNNTATTNGGAIFSSGETTAISSTFRDNTAGALGGAIYNCNYEDCTFIGNSEPEIYFDEQYRKDVIITVYAPDIMVGDILHLNITLSPNITAPVTVSLNGTEMNVSVVNGTGTLHVANLSAGNYPILAIFNGTYEYNESIASSSFTVSKYDSFVNITKTDLDSNVILDNKFVYGTEFLIEVTNNTAPVIVTINGAEYPVSEGKVVVNTAELSAGNYTVIARIPESGMFHASEQNMTFTITTKDVAITIETVNIFVDQNEIVTVIFNDNITCSVIVQISQEVKSGGQLPSGNQFISIGNFSSNGTSSVVPGNVPVSTAGFDMNYTIKIINGRGILNVSGLPSGKYTATAYFYGDENHNPAGASSNFTVSKYSTTLNITVDDIRVGEYPVVYIVFSDNITGNVSVSARPVGESSRVSSTAKVENGRANVTIYQVVYMQPSISLGDFIAGDYIIEVEFNGNERYNAVTASANLTVLKHDLNVNIDYSNDDKTVTVTPDSDITGNVTFTVAESAYDVGPGGMTISLAGLASGNYTCVLNYPGDDKYDAYSKEVNISITRKEANVTVAVEDITYGESENVEAVVPEGATGEVVFILFKNNMTYLSETVIPVNGLASWSMPDLDSGSYTLKATYSGDANYERSSIYEKKFSVAPNIDISPKVKIGDDGVIVIEVGNIEGKIAVYVDDFEDGSRNIRNKVFSYTIQTDDYSVGYHNITFEYIGNDLDENVFKEWDNQTQQYVPIKYVLYITQRPTDTAMDSDSDQKFVLVLEDDDGTVLTNATGNVTFTIMDEFANVVGEYVVEIVDGVASIDISQYKNGNYLISWSYAGDEKHTAISRQVKLDIVHKASRIDAGDLKMQYTQSKVYSVKLYGNDGKPLVNTKTEFLAGSKLIASATTNANGIASVSISYLPGTYSLTVRAPGKTVVKRLTVSHILTLKTVKVKRSAKKLVLTASLAKVNGKYLKSKWIAFKFNGKKYSAKTNKKGVAKVTVKKSVLKKLKKGKKVKYQATYLKDTVIKSTKVK